MCIPTYTFVSNELDPQFLSRFSSYTKPSKEYRRYSFFFFHFFKVKIASLEKSNNCMFFNFVSVSIEK